MPLFGSSKDSLFLKSISRELMHRVISVEVALFKLALPEMEINLYGESNKKVYYQPLRIFSLVSFDETAMNDIDTGIDTSQTAVFSFLRDDLKDLDVVLDEGDIIKWDAKYYEIDNLRFNQYWMGRNPDTLPITTEGRSNDMGYGYNIAVRADCHLTRQSSLQLVEVRSGINSIRTANMPKNL